MRGVVFVLIPLPYCSHQESWGWSPLPIGSKMQLVETISNSVRFKTLHYLPASKQLRSGDFLG